MAASDYLIGGNDEHGINPPTQGKRTPIMPNLGRPFYENEFNKAAKNFFLEACVRVGFNVFDVKPGDRDISVSARVAEINRRHLSALATFAYNASGDGVTFNNANGFEVFYSLKNPSPVESRQLSQYVYNAISVTSPLRGRGVKTLDVGVLASVNCPSTLIEAGFMTNLREAQLMLDPDFQRIIGEATCAGFCNFFNVRYFIYDTGSKLPTLKIGSKGNYVKYLQYRLLNEGYEVGAIDGAFGAKTYNAVRRLQEDLGLRADGVVGPKTWAKLLDYNLSKPTLRRGDRNKYVRYLQQKLTSKLYNVGTIDGAFGSRTENAIKKLQSDTGKRSTGVVDENTWESLFAM